ncbi:MAG TPA: hypothetical protein VFM80_00720 [Gracilimonas sp.]|nr:hypothetical protein [Gracilimonas sp.]
MSAQKNNGGDYGQIDQQKAREAGASGTALRIWSYVTRIRLAIDERRLTIFEELWKGALRLKNAQYIKNQII